MHASLLLLLRLADVGSSAHAAEVTAMPEPLRGSAALEYTAGGDLARLLEDEEHVATRHHRDHTLSFDLSFSPVRALALGLSLPIVLDERISWGFANQMFFDPTLGVGSMAGTAPLEPPPLLKGGGLAGPLLTLSAAPFHRQLYRSQVDRTSWVLTFGYRFQDKTSFWATDDAGKRGGGSGADALHISTAWSTERRTSRPYLRASLDRAFTVPTALRDETGAVLTQGAEVKPATDFALRAGAELPVATTDDLEVAINLRTRAGYRTWQDIPSGIFLPDVLEASRAVLVTQGERVSITGGIGGRFRIQDMVDVALGGDFGTETPSTVEHPYTITTGPGVFVWAADLSVRVWFEDRLLKLDPEAVGGQ